MSLAPQDIAEIPEEVKNLTGINERFDKEPAKVQDTRLQYAMIFINLCERRDRAGRSEAGRNFSIAITELENSCIRNIKALYSE
jgi:hypothetical protein